MKEVTELLCKMISIPSLSGEESQLADFVSNYLKEYCDSVYIDSMFNVVAEIKGNRPGQTVLFNSHMDHVPEGDMENPYKPQIIDGQAFNEKGTAICGRGACDNKGALASMMVASKRLANDRSFSGKLILMFVAQEENGEAPGTIFALKNLGQQVDVAILGEATGLDIFLGHRGKVEFFLETYGKSAHASNPKNGVNAVVLMSDFIKDFENLLLPNHEILGKCTSAITYISCPDPGKNAILPDKAFLKFDRRFLPDESVESVYQGVEDILKNISKQDEQFKYNLEINYVMPSFYTDKTHPFIDVLSRAIQKSTGKDPKFGAWLFGGDGAFMVNDFSIPTIGFGPASEKFAHTLEDHVLEEELVNAVEVYEEIMRNNI